MKKCMYCGNPIKVMTPPQTGDNQFCSIWCQKIFNNEIGFAEWENRMGNVFDASV